MGPLVSKRGVKSGSKNSVTNRKKYLCLKGKGKNLNAASPCDQTNNTDQMHLARTKHRKLTGYCLARIIYNSPETTCNTMNANLSDYLPFWSKIITNQSGSPKNMKYGDYFKCQVEQINNNF